MINMGDPKIVKVLLIADPPGGDKVAAKLGAIENVRIDYARDNHRRRPRRRAGTGA